ncbi:hypothetical protein BS47DRAFT_1154138 [Hydnum rufescens UP504]|uniref:Crg1 n=1 Tax=Hydnum rufescens UP504 TaxID=1448309 RepID=A0A9P6B847_9AGAM|nr:hypothetical protein BS47DRAFT_1154138 [Hydnum rufescens UP504]
MAGTGSEEGASTSHMMKTTKRGRPFLKDTLDLFATLIVSLELTTHKQFFRTFPNSFTTDEAAANLASLKFSQSNRGPDPKNPNRVVTTTTTTTFSMTRDMAKSMAQHFMDARLIENAADRSSNVFKERGVFVLTPKGLHILERFISKNGMSADHLVKVFESQPVCMKLLHLERRPSDDDIITTEAVILSVFRRFAGRSPNYMPQGNDSPLDPTAEYYERSKGIPVSDVQDRAPQIIGKGPIQTHRHCFTAVSALEWLCDFTSIVGRDEAAEMAAHFLRYHLIELISDKRKSSDQAIIFTVRGHPTNGAFPEAEFRCTPKAIYRITDVGRQIAKWDMNSASGSPGLSVSNLPQGSDRSSTDVGDDAASGPAPSASGETIASSTDAKIHRRISMAERLRADYRAGEGGDSAPHPKTSNTDRLRKILEEPALRSLFREFLRSNFCEENLCFWLDVQDFKRRFHTTSSANANTFAGRPSTSRGSQGTVGQAAMEKHHESLVTMTFVIYNTYLAPSSPCELNIDHGLRNELVAYLNEVLTLTTGMTVKGLVKPEHANTFNATQLQTMIKLYERIQIHVFRLMATDSVPNFIKTPRFLGLRSWVEDIEQMENDDYIATGRAPAAPPGLGGDPNEEIGRTYMTISQAANEKAQDKLKNAKLVAQMGPLSDVDLADVSS